MKTYVAKICLWHKCLSKNGKCPKCGNSRFINVEYTKKRISPWYAIRRKYEYTVLNPRYKFIESKLNEQQY